MRIQNLGAACLLLLLFSGCAGMDAAPPEQADEDALSIAALFQTENGDALQGSAACFSTENDSRCCPLDPDGTVRVCGLPRSGELLLTLFSQQQEPQGAMTLLLAQGSVTDAATSEDGVGHITVRNDANQVALLFVLTEDSGLQCTLWLTNTAASRADLPRKGA